MKIHHQIRLRILSCSRVSENHRGPEVPEEKAPAVECRDGLARITSKELAITHPAKDGILLNACSTRTRMVAVLGKSALLHIVRLTHSRRNGQNRIMTKAPWLEQRRTIIAEYSEKVLHHELLAAHAEQDRKVLQEELLRQQQEFREVHQQDLMKHQELQKFQNSAFDEFTQKKFIEDQKTIMELSGRVQELQNEVNCMSDSRDFRDAESICSGNSHVTSPPGLFPRHPPFEGMLKPAFISQRQNEEQPNIRDTSGTSRNVIAHPQASSSAPYPQESNSTWKKNY